MQAAASRKCDTCVDTSLDCLSKTLFLAPRAVLWGCKKVATDVLPSAAIGGLAGSTFGFGIGVGPGAALGACHGALKNWLVAPLQQRIDARSGKGIDKDGASYTKIFLTATALGISVFATPYASGYVPEVVSNVAASALSYAPAAAHGLMTVLTPRYPVVSVLSNAYVVLTTHVVTELPSIVKSVQSGYKRFIEGYHSSDTMEQALDAAATVPSGTMQTFDPQAAKQKFSLWTKIGQGVKHAFTGKQA